MKHLFSVVTILVLVAVLPGSFAIKCKTGAVTRECNTCICSTETGQISHCSLVGCGSYQPVQCTDGEEMVNEDGNSCECDKNHWYCDIPPKKKD